MDINTGFLPDCDEIEGLDAPPRMSQEINPQNLADLFADDPGFDANNKAEAPLSQQVSRAMAFAGAGIDDEFEMKKLQVFVRIRPTTNNAAVSASTSSHWDAENCIHAAAKHTLAIAPPEGSMAYRSGDRGQTFTFSQVFEAATTQEEYFSATAAPMVDDLLRNPQHNSVMMAYGITAAGKTYTIEGTKSAPGVLPRALTALFDGIAHHMDADSLAVRVSYCEIYNESVYDLIEEAHNGWVQKRPALKLMEDARGRVSVAGLSEVEVTSAEEALGVLRRGAKHRQRAETGLNFSSSRSHSIFGIHLVRRQEVVAAAADGEEGVESATATTNAAAAMQPVKVERLGRMSFVDLAGSERAQRTGNVGIRLKESVAINSSLMTLGRCLEALRWNQQQQALSRNANGAAAAGPLKVVPYRESKVTHLFRDALHGYGRVVLSVNVSPCAKDYDETAHVLRYASLATAIGTLQQAEAPRRTIKAVTPGALRRAKRKAAAKVAKDEAEKKAKNAAEAAEQAQKAAMEAELAKAAAEAAEPTPSVALGTMEPSVTGKNTDACAYEAATTGTAAVTGPPPPNSAGRAATAAAEGEEEVVYVVMGRRLLSDEFDYVAAPNGDGDAAAPSSAFAQGKEKSRELQEMNDEFEVGFHCTRGDSEAEEEEYTDDEGANTPSTPCSDDYDKVEGEEEEEENEAIAALQAQVRQLIRDLQAAEERAVLLEGEVREEVAGEMAGLLKDMEESYRERLTAEVAAAEARAAKNAGKGGKKKARGGKKGDDTDENLEPPTASAAETAKALEQAELEIASLRAELELHQAEAREQAERLLKAQETAAAARAAADAATEELALVQARADSLAAALADSRRSSEEIVEVRLREEVTQLEANAAMELEMAEQQAERLRKENMSLRQQLAAAMVTLETVSSPSIPMLQRMAAACTAGGVGGAGCGAGGTPHDVALARARQAAAAEDAAAAAAAAANASGDGSALLSQGRSNGHRSTGPQKSRFGEEALALAAATQTQPESENGGDKTPAPGLPHATPVQEHLEVEKDTEEDCDVVEEAMTENNEVFVAASEAMEMEKEDQDDVQAALRALEEAEAEAAKEVERLMALAQEQEDQKQQEQEQEDVVDVVEISAAAAAAAVEEKEEIDIPNSLTPVGKKVSSSTAAAVTNVLDDVAADAANADQEEEEENPVLEEKVVEEQDVVIEEALPAAEEEVAVDVHIVEEAVVVAEEENEEEEEQVKPKGRGGRKKAAATSRKNKKAGKAAVEEAEEQQPVVKRSRRGRKAAAEAAADVVEEVMVDASVAGEVKNGEAAAVVLAEEHAVEPIDAKTAEVQEEEQEEEDVKPAARSKGHKRGRKPKPVPVVVEEEEKEEEVALSPPAASPPADAAAVVAEDVKQADSQHQVILEENEEDLLSVVKPRARSQRRNIVLLDSSSDEEEEKEEEMVVEEVIFKGKEEILSDSDAEEEEETVSEVSEEEDSDDDYVPSFGENEEEEEKEKEEKVAEVAQKKENDESLKENLSIVDTMPVEEAVVEEGPAAVEEKDEEQPRRQTRRSSRAPSVSTLTKPEKQEEKEEGEEEKCTAKPEPAVKPAPAPAPAGRKRRLLQVSKPLSTEMRSALGELATADIPGGVSIARKGMPGTKKGTSMAVALGLSPAPARQKSPKRSRCHMSTELE